VYSIPSTKTWSGGEFMKKKDFVKWTIEVHVHESWVMDGFNIQTQEDIIHLLKQRLPLAYGFELGGKIIKRPDARLIKSLQGASC